MPLIEISNKMNSPARAYFTRNRVFILCVASVTLNLSEYGIFDNEIFLYTLVNTISLPAGGGRQFYPVLLSHHCSPKDEPDSRGEAIACHIESLFSPSHPFWPIVRGPSALAPGSLGRGSLVQGQT